MGKALKKRILTRATVRPMTSVIERRTEREILAILKRTDITGAEALQAIGQAVVTATTGRRTYRPSKRKTGERSK